MAQATKAVKAATKATTVKKGQAAKQAANVMPIAKGYVFSAAYNVTPVQMHIAGTISSKTGYYPTGNQLVTLAPLQPQAGSKVQAYHAIAKSILGGKPMPANKFIVLVGKHANCPKKGGGTVLRTLCRNWAMGWQVTGQA